MNWRWLIGGTIALAILLGGIWLEYKFSLGRIGRQVLTSPDRPLSQVEKLRGSNGPAVSFKNDIGQQHRGYISSIDESKREIKLLTGQGLQTYTYDENTRWLCLPPQMPDSQGNPIPVVQAFIDTSKMTLPEDKLNGHLGELNQSKQIIAATSFKDNDEVLEEITNLVIKLGCDK